MPAHSSLSARQLVLLIGPLANGPGPAYRRLADQIRSAIRDGRITSGTRLPSERALAAASGISRTTTTRAYEALREEALVVTRQGSGSVVDVPLERVGAVSLLAKPEGPDGLSLVTAATAASPAVAGVIDRALRGLPTLLATDGYLPDGLPLLRARIAERYTAEGLPTDAAQIVVTTGAQGALALVCAVLIRPGDRALIEGCGFPHADDLLARSGARLVPLPIADTPWPVEDIARLAPGVDLALLVPDFHNPTGALMTSDERRTIARTLSAAGVRTIVDETMRDTHLGDGPLPEHFAQHDPSAIVVGSVSKSMWGGLRVGWVRAPHSLVPRLIQTRMSMDLGSAAIDQLIAATALDPEHGYDTGEHLADLRERRDALLAALGRRLPAWRTTRPTGGVSVWVTLPAPLSTALTLEAESESLTVTPGPRFFPTLPAVGERHLRIPYALPPDRLEDAVERLASAWDRVVLRGPAGSVDPDAVNLIA